jgi:MFS family permease
MFILLLNGALQTWHLYILVFVSALAGSFQWPAFSAATTMLVPQEHLGRAAGLSQIGEALSALLTPALAGFLYLSIGLEGIFLIDLVTFVFAVATMLVITIPEPERTKALEPSGKPSLGKEIRVGWDFIMARPGLLLLLLYIAAINFGLGFTDPLYTPLFLSMGDAQQVGIAFSVLGLGSLVGTLIMSAWGGPQRRVNGVLFSGLALGATYIFFGLRPWLGLVALAGFGRNLVLPIMLGSSQALWQAKTPPDIQGRVFSVRRLIAQFTSPISTLIAGPLVDDVLQPAMEPGGALADSVGAVIGVGLGRGSALVFVAVGVFGILVTLAFLVVPKLRTVDTDIPNVEVKVRAEATA